MNLSFEDELNKVVQGYLRANQQEADSISNAIPVTGAESEDSEHCIYFVFNGEEVVGFLNVYDGDVSRSSYIQTKVDLTVGEEISIYSDDEEVLLFNGAEAVHLAGKYHDLSQTIFSDCDLLEVECYELQENQIYETQSTMDSPIYYYLSVPYVANEYSPLGLPLCWAACIASRKNYHSGTSYSAMDVYNACLNSTQSGKPSGFPVGNDDWIPFGYSIFGINVTNVDGGKNLGQIENLLASDKPIHCSFRNSSNNNNHGVLLMGVYIETWNRIYMFRDSNEVGGVSISVSTAALTDPTQVAYTSTTTGTLPEWYRSIY